MKIGVQVRMVKLLLHIRTYYKRIQNASHRWLFDYVKEVIIFVLSKLGSQSIRKFTISVHLEKDVSQFHNYMHFLSVSELPRVFVFKTVPHFNLLVRPHMDC